MPIKSARRVDVGLACVDIRPSPKTDVLVFSSQFRVRNNNVVVEAEYRSLRHVTLVRHAFSRANSSSIVDVRRSSRR